MAKKIYKVAVTESLLTILPGESLTFIVAGDGAEAKSIEALRTLAARYHLVCNKVNDGVAVTVSNPVKA